MGSPCLRPWVRIQVPALLVLLLDGLLRGLSHALSTDDAHKLQVPVTQCGFVFVPSLKRKLVSFWSSVETSVFSWTSHSSSGASVCLPVTPERLGALEMRTVWVLMFQVFVNTHPPSSHGQSPSKAVSLLITFALVWELFYPRVT